jgi:hypothetical protein
VSHFLVFAGSRFYPGGGWRDFHSAHATAEGAIETAKQLVIGRARDWSHVTDVDANKEVKVFTRIVSDVWMFDTLITEADDEGGFTNGLVIDQGDPA